MGVSDIKGSETSSVGEAGRDPLRLVRALQESGVIRWWEGCLPQWPAQDGGKCFYLLRMRGLLSQLSCPPPKVKSEWRDGFGGPWVQRAGKLTW